MNLNLEMKQVKNILARRMYSYDELNGATNKLNETIFDLKYQNQYTYVLYRDSNS